MYFVTHPKAETYIHIFWISKCDIYLTTARCSFCVTCSGLVTEHSSILALMSTLLKRSSIITGYIVRVSAPISACTSEVDSLLSLKSQMTFKIRLPSHLSLQRLFIEYLTHLTNGVVEVRCYVKMSPHEKNVCYGTQFEIIYWTLSVVRSSTKVFRGAERRGRTQRSQKCVILVLHN